MNLIKPKLVRVSTVALSTKMFCMNLIESISSRYDVVIVSSPGEELDELEQAGWRVCRVGMHRRISLLADIVSLIKLYRLFRQERPDIVHSMTPKAGLLSMIAAKVARVPIRLHTFTGLLFPTATGIKKTILKSTDFITCFCATNLQAEGKGVRSDLLKAGVCRKPVDVLGYGNLRGIDLDYYRKTDTLVHNGWEECKRIGISYDTKIILFVGRIVKDKGIIELVDAFQRFSAKCNDWALLMVGKEEPEEDPLPAVLKSRIHLCPNIFCTHRWVDDVRPFYAVARMLVLPSYREGFPNVVLEGGAMSLPSIVTDVNGSREIIRDGFNGLVVPPHDTLTLSHAMRVLSLDKFMRKEMGEKARRLVAERYEIGYVTKCNADYYESLLK